MHVSLPSSFCAADDVLKYFQDQFIKDADAKAILFDLKLKGSFRVVLKWQSIRTLILDNRGSGS